MTRYERRQMFERLCTMRDAYRMAPESEVTAVISIADAIAWAEDLLSQPAPEIAADAPSLSATDGSAG
jgi:hypothetical protein